MASNTRDAGVSRLSIGFRHLVDWGSETNSSRTTQGLTPFQSTTSSLSQYIKYNMKGESESLALPGGGFPRAEAAVYTGLHNEIPLDYSSNPDWFNRYVRQMEYIVAEQNIGGENANPGIPTRRWIYGSPSGPKGGKAWKQHSAGDPNTPTFERLLKADVEQPINILYTKLYFNLLRSMGRLQGQSLQNVLRFIESDDPALRRMANSLIIGLLRSEIPFDEAAEEAVSASVEAAGGRLGGASKQEILAELTGRGLAVIAGHAQLGGSDPVDVLFHEDVEISWPDPVNGPNSITVRLVELTEEDWTDGGHHGTGYGTSGLTTAPAIMDYYNDERIPQYNNIISLVKNFVDAMEPTSGGLSTSGNMRETQEAQYRRTANQLASNLLKHKSLSGGARGSTDDLFIVLSQGIAQEEAWAASMLGATDELMLKDLVFVLHHMGNAGTIYDDPRFGPQSDFEVNQYGEMVSFDQGNGEEYSVIINFRVRADGGFEQLQNGDVAVTQQSINDILLAVWRSQYTDAQLDEAFQLATTARGMSAFASYFTEQAGVAATVYGSSRFTARADAAIPAHMDNLMYVFFHVGNAKMKKGMNKLLKDMRSEADTFSSSLRASLSSELSNRWPNFAWGSSNRRYGGGNDDRTHSEGRYPPMALARQFSLGIDFGHGGQFFPQVDTNRTEDGNQMWPFQTDAEYEAEHGFSMFANSAQRSADGIQGGTPNRKRVRPEHGVTDFEQAAIANYSGSLRLSHWWRAAPVVWSSGDTARTPPPDPLEFVWAAPYVVWQHYQVSGSA